jgi:hypothetical protein
MASAEITIVMDDAYLREMHREWVAVFGKGWRTVRILAALFSAAAVLFATAWWHVGGAVLQFCTVFAFLSALMNLLTLGFRRAAWMAHCRALPWYGRPLRIELRDGDLVQVKDFAGDPTYKRIGLIVATPNGYLVKYRRDAPATEGPVSSTDASIYVAHRNIVPSMTRETFLAKITALRSAAPPDEGEAAART